MNFLLRFLLFLNILGKGRDNVSFVSPRLLYSEVLQEEQEEQHVRTQHRD